MPELPDLVHIVKTLGPGIEGRHISHATVKNPIVLRVLVPGAFPDLVTGRRITGLMRHGPFLKFDLGGLDLVMHLMLAGRLRLSGPRDSRPGAAAPDAAASDIAAEIGPAHASPSNIGRALPFTAFSLELEEGLSLHYADEKSMGKVYLCPAGSFESIPGYLTQGIDVTSPEFTFEAFSALIAKKRCQARVFIMDQTCLSAIGNAYADEILFEARIHPKAPCYSLGPERRRALYEAVRSVLAWGIEEVEKAGLPLEDKARDHMRVRGRAGEKCPRCGATIRRTGVLGYDSFFCPSCQPDLTGRGLDWTKLPRR